MTLEEDRADIERIALSRQDVPEQEPEAMVAKLGTMLEYLDPSEDAERQHRQDAEPVAQDDRTEPGSHQMIPIQLTDILARLDHISEVWRSDTAAEQRTDLAQLDALLGRLDDTEPVTAGEAERIDELRGRIEILMDEIEISLGIEPPAFFSPEDLDTGP